MRGRMKGRDIFVVVLKPWLSKREKICIDGVR